MVVRHARSAAPRGPRRRWALPPLALSAIIAAPCALTIAATNPGHVAPRRPAVHVPRERGPADPAGAGRAVTKVSNTVAFSALGWDTSRVVTGPNPTLVLSMPGPGDVVLGPATRLSLVYGGSPALDARRSRLSVSVNGVYVASRSVRGGANRPATLTIRIPATALVSDGYNRLRLTFDLRHDKSPKTCGAGTDLNATVYGSSTLAYDVRGRDQSLFQPDLAQLPAPFALSSSTTFAPTRITVGLPVTPTVAETAGAAHTLARFSEDEPAHSLLAPIVRATSLIGQAPQGDVLLVGTPRDNPAIAALALSTPLLFVGPWWRDAQGLALPPDEGVIVETPNPWDPHGAILMLTGNGQGGIARAETVMSSAVLRHGLHGPYALISAAPRLPAAARDALTLRGLGFRAVTQEGAGDHTMGGAFDLARPPLGDGALTLAYSHSAALDPAMSSVRVELNGRPLASRRLDATGSPRKRWRISLPARVLRLGTNVLAVRFHFEAMRTSCSPLPTASIWGAIDPLSIVTLPRTGGRAHPTLGNLPYPLVIDGDPRGTTLVAPDGARDIGDTLNLAVRLGRRSDVDAPRFAVLSASQATPARLRGHAVLLYDIPLDDPLMRRIQGDLPLRLAETGSAFQLTGQPRLSVGVPRATGDMGVVEEIESPWDRTQMAVVVVASRPALLSKARNLLLGGVSRGTAATVDAAGRVRMIDAHDNAVGVARGASRGAPASPRPIRLLGLTGLGLLVLVLGMGVLRGVRRAEGEG
jgi:hypothetical protein